MCFGRELKLLIDVLRGAPTQKLESEENNYVLQLRRKLNVLLEEIRQQLYLRSRRVKVLYDRKVRRF